MNLPDRPERPECFEFAMDFLSDPEEPFIREYVEALEARADAADARVAVERERCAKLCEERAGSGPDEFDYPGVHYAILDCAKLIRGVAERRFPLREDAQP